MNEYLDFILSQNQDDPLAVLRNAQEQLRLEEERKEKEKEAQGFAEYRKQALKKAIEDDPLGTAQQMLTQSRSNSPLQQVMERTAQNTPLDKLAQISPEEIERQMYERMWGKPAKTKIGKVGKGIGDILGLFSGAPRDFSKPAMEQFLKIQEQYRKERANDLTAMTQAAQITGRENVNKDKLLLDLFKTKGKSQLDIVKGIDQIIKTDAYVDSVNNMDKYLSTKTDIEREKLKLEARKISSTIRNDMEYGLRMSELVKSDPQMAALVRANYIDSLQQRAGMAAASKSGNTRTTTMQTPIRSVDPETGQPRVDLIPRTTTSSTEPNPLGAQFMQQNPYAQFMGGQIQKLPIPSVEKKAIVESIVPTSNPVTQKASGKPSEGYKLVEIKRINPPGVKSILLPGTNEKVRQRNDKVVTISDSANMIIDAFVDGTAQRVLGAVNQPISIAERAISNLREFAGKSGEQGSKFETAPKDINAWMNRFKGDDKAQRFLQSFQLIDTKRLGDYIKEMSGTQASTSEAARLKQLFPSLSDPPEITLQKSVELMLLVGTLEAINSAGLGVNELNATSNVRNKIRQERLNKILNNVRSAHLLKQAGRDEKHLLPSPADFDFNSLLAETEEQSGIKFKNIIFQNYVPKKKKISARGTLMERAGKPALAPEEDQDEILNQLIQKAKGR